MATKITQLEESESGKTILRVEGEMFLDDALLLEKISLQMREGGARDLTIDLADLNFLDSDSAPVLKRIEREHNFKIVGIEYFLQTIVNEAENKNRI